ncbi:ThiF family adenylyltransferase [Alkalicoccus urumqiensis]
MERYSRQIRFSGIQKSGQETIQKADVLIIGAGALGSAAAETLVRAGAGSVTIVDRDYVESSNLQRQQLYTEKDAADGVPKAAAAALRLKEINSSVEVTGLVEEITPASESLFQGRDVIIDALDNFETRLVINDFACRFNIPWIYAAVVSSYGMSFTILPGETPCLRCLLPVLPQGGETCDTAGVIAPAVQMVSAVQSTEALKLLSGNNEALRKTFLHMDIWHGTQQEIGVGRMRRLDCPSCGSTPEYPALKHESVTKTAVLCGRDTVQVRPAGQVVFNEILERLSPFAPKANNHLLQVTLEGKKVVVFRDGRALIHETSDKVQALSLYQRYIVS